MAPMTNCLHSVSVDSFFAAMNPDPTTLVSGDDEDNNDGDGSHKVKQSRPSHLVVAPSPFFTIPPGLSPSALLDSPQSPLGMSHQQALAQVTTQAMQANDEPLILHPSFTLNDANSKQKVAPFELEQSEISHTNNNKYQMPSSLAIDKPADDGYNWRKYGQKQAKGSEFPRSYYKCTHLNCYVKKKVDRASDGHITEITYKGQHRHEKPKGNRGVKDNNYGSNENVGIHHAKYESNLQQGVDCSVPIEGEEMGDEDIWEEEGDASEPNLKRRNTNVGVSEVPLPHKTVTEPKIIVQTRSEVDILDDGYRWRKYGQKVVKGSPHPRSYYKCTSAGCKVRKQVERASVDPKVVITTYEGKHNHDVPAARNCIGHNIATINSMPLKPHKVVPPKLPLLKDMGFGNNDQRSVRLPLKEEQIIV